MPWAPCLAPQRGQQRLHVSTASYASTLNVNVTCTFPSSPHCMQLAVPWARRTLPLVLLTSTWPSCGRGSRTEALALSLADRGREQTIEATPLVHRLCAWRASGPTVSATWWWYTPAGARTPRRTFCWALTFPVRRGESRRWQFPSEQERSHCWQKAFLVSWGESLQKMAGHPGSGNRGMLF